MLLGACETLRCSEERKTPSSSFNVLERILSDSDDANRLTAVSAFKHNRFC